MKIIDIGSRWLEAQNFRYILSSLKFFTKSHLRVHVESSHLLRRAPDTFDRANCLRNETKRFSFFFSSIQFHSVPSYVLTESRRLRAEKLSLLCHTVCGLKKFSTGTRTKEFESRRVVFTRDLPTPTSLHIFFSNIQLFLVFRLSLVFKIRWQFNSKHCF